MTSEDIFFFGLVLYLAVPVLMVCWSLVIEWYLFDRAQKAAMETEWREWQGSAAPMSDMIGIRAYQSDTRYFHKGREIDWIVDHIGIRPEDIIILADENLDEYYKREIQYHGEALVEIRKIPFLHPLRFLSHLTGFQKPDIMRAIWQTIADLYPLRHYIVYNDFTNLSSVRNQVLRERGCQTWFYIHACNTAEVFGSNAKLVPFELLDYDHLIAWNSAVADHYVKHGGKFRQIHIVGCLWGEK